MFELGKIIKTFTSKKGNTIVLRLAQSTDLVPMTDYINEISREDTFILLGGEQMSLEEEQKYLDSALEKMEKGDGFQLFAFINNNLIGSGHVTRQDRRSKHVGALGISIKKEYRQEGIGSEMMQAFIEGAKKMELKMILLGCFANNPTAYTMYKKFGFEEHGRVPKAFLYKGDYIDEIKMHLML